jgi:hypothetical protein
VCVASIAVLAVAIASNNMASLISGVDPQAETYVDERLRRARVRGAFAIGICIPFVFVAMVGPFTTNTPVHIAAFGLLAIAWCVSIVPLLVKQLPVWRSSS